RVHERGLAGADRTADADAQRPVGVAGHDRNSRVYCVSWRMLARSARNAAPPTSSSALSSALFAVAATTGSRAATNRSPPVRPTGPSPIPAEIQVVAIAWR